MRRNRVWEREDQGTSGRVIVPSPSFPSPLVPTLCVGTRKGTVSGTAGWEIFFHRAGKFFPPGKLFSTSGRLKAKAAESDSQSRPRHAQHPGGLGQVAPRRAEHLGEEVFLDGGHH